YRVEAQSNGEWTVLAAVSENRKRRNVHRLDRAVKTDRLKLIIESTNGTPFAEVVAIRIV
ncbi:MAG: pyridine nucleotide-disulfide oxidoreductase, partial [Paenibacillus sp.]|nr:pyridine nucleotide-disulfide oxidoreductase [Paenibacillus sp.]